MTTTEPDAASRRERNKATTRAAIARAALELLRSRGPGGFRAEDIAEAAGVSRRTFFNYFASTEAALVVSTEELLDAAVSRFDDRPADEPLLESMLHAIKDQSEPRFLPVSAELFGISRQRPEMMRYQLEAWAIAEDKIADVVRRRVGDPTDSLYVSALVASVLACARAAFNQWADEYEPRDNHSVITDESSARLEALMVEAISTLSRGFTR